jgi:hypothetical protein
MKNPTGPWSHRHIGNAVIPGHNEPGSDRLPPHLPARRWVNHHGNERNSAEDGRPPFVWPGRAARHPLAPMSGPPVWAPVEASDPDTQTRTGSTPVRVSHSDPIEIYASAMTSTASSAAASPSAAAISESVLPSASIAALRAAARSAAAARVASSARRRSSSIRADF